DEIAETPDRIRRVAVDRGEDGFECREIRVHVRDDGDPHQRIFATRSPTSVGTVAGTVAVTTRRRPHAPAAQPVATAARTRCRAPATPRSAAAAKSSQPIVADPNVASASRGIGCPAAVGSAAWWSAVAAGPTCG